MSSSSKKASSLKIFDSSWSIYAIFAIINSAIAFLHNAPFVFPDEYGPLHIANHILGNHRWGYNPTLYYGYVSSPFIVPALAIFEDIRAVYICALVIKSFLVALIPFFTYKILREVLEVEVPSVRVLIAMAVGCFPSIIVYSKYLSNDTMLHVILFTCFYLIAKCAKLERGEGRIRRWLYSVLLAFFAVLAYGAHGMGIAFIVAVFMLLVVTHIFTLRPLVNYPLFLSSFAGFFYIDRLLKAAVRSALFSASRRSSSGASVNSFEHEVGLLTENISREGFIAATFKTGFSRIYYVFSSSFGFFQLSVIVLIVFAALFIWNNFKSKGKDKPRNITSERVLFTLVVFSFVIIGCGIGLSTLNNWGPTAGRFVFYGRYYDYMMLPTIIVGLYYIFCREIKKKTLLIYSAITAVSFVLYSIWVHFYVIADAVKGSVAAFFILGILPYVDASRGRVVAFGRFDHSLISLVVVNLVIFGVAVYMLFDTKKMRVFSIALLVGMFAFGSYFGLTTTTMRSSRLSYNNSFPITAEARDVLEQHRYLQEEVWWLFIISDSIVGSATNTHVVQGRGQLNFTRFTIARTAKKSTWRSVQKYDNYMVFTDMKLKASDIDRNAVQIYESDGANIWLVGEDILAFYRDRVGG
ncbi:MAG: hypothetical protein FWG87_09040 [Defluviitaleaceae bacterium]|nr:hypothetical protein [Defluviitaleaceae bacterium]